MKQMVLIANIFTFNLLFWLPVYQNLLHTPRLNLRTHKGKDSNLLPLRSRESKIFCLHTQTHLRIQEGNIANLFKKKTKKKIFLGGPKNLVIGLLLLCCKLLIFCCSRKYTHTHTLFFICKGNFKEMYHQPTQYLPPRDQVC